MNLVDEIGRLKFEYHEFWKNATSRLFFVFHLLKINQEFLRPFLVFKKSVYQQSIIAIDTNMYFFFESYITAIQYCGYKIVPLGAERRYQPIKIVYLLSPSILIGALSEVSGVERTLHIIFPICSRFLFFF